MMKIERNGIVTNEELLTQLFKLGFDRIDPVLYTYTLESLQDINFEFSKDDKISDEFKEHLEMDGPIYKLKKDMNHEALFEKNKNDQLLDYIPFIDFVNIVLKKIKLYGLSTYDVDSNRFSEKELKIIKDLNERVKAFDEIQKNYEEIEEMKIHTDYITWLIEFTNKQESKVFYDADCLCYDDKYSEEDKENVKKLCNFIRTIGDYANDTGLPVDYESIKVKYKDIFLEVGEFHGQGTLDYAKILHEENSDEVIDYEELVKYYSRIASNICPPPTFKECSKKLKNIPNKKDI